MILAGLVGAGVVAMLLLAYALARASGRPDYDNVSEAWLGEHTRERRDDA